MHKLIKLIGKSINGLARVAPTLAGKIGFNIFCTPFSPKIKPYQLAFLDSAEKFSITIDGNKVQCYKWGNGSKKVLFIHGWASFTFRWKKYIEYFSKSDYTIYAYDAKAHGLSCGKTVNLIINANYIKEVVKNIGGVDAAICHSFGGFTLSYLLKHYPETDIGKAVIMGAPGEAIQFFEFYREKLFLSERATEIIIEQFKMNFKETPQYFSSPAFAKYIKIPCLIVHDKNDEEAPIETAIALQKNWEGSKIIITEGLGHHLKSDELMVEVEEFVNN